VQESGAESGAVDARNGAIDPDLMAVVNAWRRLTETTKQQIVGLVKVSGSMK